MTDNTEKKVIPAKDASIKLASINTLLKNKGLEAMAEALDQNRNSILKANRKDLEYAEQLKNQGKISQALVDRLKVNDSKIDGMIAGIRDVMELEDPTGKTLSCLELDEGLELYQVSCPIGLIGVIFESRPDVVPQIMSLCLKSGNATIFKGGSEAFNSNRTIFNILKEAIEEIGDIPAKAFQLMETREEVMDILALDSYIDLLIPRGSNAFVKFIQDNTRIPVLGHADGICHVYVDNEADIEKAIDVCYDSKVQYPAVCNAMETLLVNSDIASKFLPEMIEKFVKAGVEVRLDEKTYTIAEDKGIRGLKKASEEDWSTEYNDLILSVKMVDSMNEAIDHINRYGSHHTDCIVTKSKDKRRTFTELVDSSSVMVNASTRFADGFRYGKGAEVGISTNKIHARGPVGMEGLLIYKYILLGNGDRVSDYTGDKAKKFTHRKLDKQISDII
ncbi:glutamate-5-semialdehyde dehydrogenase [Methanohalophilus halophilus]|uniref:Gamma-glutamyl phosphate reductase n=1 Tax=Methanohalophilus halophilus TaxID=2177 RepID=A0A1L3PZM0_9EURY|nr:glutamate-5-semialdehyde dehydrogenase [Methanohalophilus halophilus]APH38074.1 glutamate-5-semialdehyde dehydrogenase [Methanohalophilus halophilus]RNI11063.1 glutamate-5-semialdehyde dehydrogenase [Methanohalophilus halophilus]SDW84091.1 glutamate-5-semialdehyde dehydrogenase [Methanohalophilus halophilus]